MALKRRTTICEWKIQSWSEKLPNWSWNTKGCVTSCVHFGPNSQMTSCRRQRNQNFRRVWKWSLTVEICSYKVKRETFTVIFSEIKKNITLSCEFVALFIQFVNLCMSHAACGSLQKKHVRSRLFLLTLFSAKFRTVEDRKKWIIPLKSAY